MPPQPQERLGQAEFALRLRAAIDTARKYPTKGNKSSAIGLALSQPVALHSSHVRHNLGSTRWEWLEARGIFPVGEGGEIAGSIKGTITPNVIKESP
jgi:hypothetical protein